MQLLGDAFLSAQALFVFAYSLQLRSSSEPNNWIRAALGVMGVGFVLQALAGFAALSTASSAQLFVFLSCVLGAVGGALAATSVRTGNWRIRGLWPDQDSPSRSAL
jgi:fructose-specific phosphotransferase system IIC component